MENWFRRFKNNGFDVDDKERSGEPKKFKDDELEALLLKDSCQAQAELAGSLRVDHNIFETLESNRNDFKNKGYWVMYELRPRDIERCLVAFE